MRTHTYTGHQAHRTARTSWLPWLLVGVTWLVAVALGLFDQRGPAPSRGPEPTTTPLTAKGALDWYAAHPRAPLPAPNSPNGQAGAAIDPAAAVAVTPPRPITIRETQPVPPQPPPRTPEARADEARPPRSAPPTVEAPANPPATPREPTHREPNRTDLAPKPTELPTIEVDGAPKEPAAAAASEPPAPTDEPKPSARPGETAQSATARATTHLNAKRWTEAEAAFTTTLALPGGQSAAVLYGRARARRAQDNKDAAEADLKAALAIDPRHPYALLLLGDLAKERGDTAAARDAYKRYVEAWPNGRRAGELTTWLGATPR